MHTILTVIKKELIDTLRDRRTLISAIIMPALLLPIMLYGFTKLQTTIMKKEESKKLKVALLDAPAMFATTFDTSKYELLSDVSIEKGRDAILNDSLDAMVAFVDGYANKVSNSGTGKVNMWYKSTNLSVKDRLSTIVDDYEQGILDTRIVDLSLTKEAINPIELYQYDIAPKKEQLGKLAGGILPYLFIIFCFTGCMYPGLDLITGEKERGTIETLLTVPASRFKILLGKVITIALVGLAAAVMTILGLVAALKFLPDIPEDLLETISNIIQFKYVMMLFIMIIPLSFFFAGMISAMVVKAKSFKEAQSILTPISFVIIMPALIGMMPGIELTWATAAIPILNIALATKEIVAGTINMGHYFFIVASLVVIAIVAVFISYKQFSKEGMVLK